MFLDRLKTLVPEEWCGRNRRRHPRHNQVNYIELQPLDNDLSLAGPSVWGMTRNVSRKGIGFTTPYWLDCVYLKVYIRACEFSGVGVIRYQHIVDNWGETTHYLVGIELLDDYELHY